MHPRLGLSRHNPPKISPGMILGGNLRIRFGLQVENINLLTVPLQGARRFSPSSVGVIFETQFILHQPHVAYSPEEIRVENKKEKRVLCPLQLGS